MSRFTLLLCLFGLTCSQVFAELGTEAIVHGTRVQSTSVKKYHAIVQSNGKIVCGGVIIDKFYVLTAAQCVTKPPGIVETHPFKVIVGTNDLHHIHEAISDSVEVIYIPKAFSFITGDHDIAILKLKNGLDLEAHHQKIEKVSFSSNSNLFLHDETAIITGFGIQSFKTRLNAAGMLEKYDFKNDGRLRYAHAKIITNQKCSELRNMPTHPSWICAQVVNKDKKPAGTCKGDTGGPLVYGNRVIGILSKTIFNCNELHHPAVYTRIFFYEVMIENIMRGRPGNDVLVVQVHQ